MLKKEKTTNCYACEKRLAKKEARFKNIKNKDLKIYCPKCYNKIFGRPKMRKI